MSYKSTQQTIQVRTDGCRYRTIIEETCVFDNATRSNKCERVKKVFRKCPNDAREVEVPDEGGNDSRREQIDLYKGRTTDV